MATTTTNYGLVKPSYNETADVAVINSNMDIIDTKMKEIENSGGGSSGGGSVNYSTEEQVIGTWIDGSILYQKTYYCGNIGNNTITNTPLNINYLRKIVYIGGVAMSVNNNAIVRPLPQVDNSSMSNCIRIDTTDTLLRTITSGDWSTYDAYITIRYTKITG